MSFKVQDDREFPIFIDYELDDFPLSAEAFRVYAHLVRRTGKNDGSWASYQKIGDVCFAVDYPNSKITRRKHAIAAMKELEDKGVVTIERRKTRERENLTNIYRLARKSKWLHSEGGSQRDLGGGSQREPGGSEEDLGRSEGEPKVLQIKNNQRSYLQNTSVATSEPIQGDMVQSVEKDPVTHKHWLRRINQLFKVNPGLRQQIMDSPIAAVMEAVEELENAIPHGEIKNRGAWFNSALQKANSKHATGSKSDIGSPSPESNGVHADCLTTNTQQQNNQTTESTNTNINTPASNETPKTQVRTSYLHLRMKPGEAESQDVKTDEGKSVAIAS